MYNSPFQWAKCDYNNIQQGDMAMYKKDDADSIELIEEIFDNSETNK